MKYTIKVTQEDIDRGVRRHDAHCPIANAIRGMGYYGVSVAGIMACFYADDGCEHDIMLPRKAQQFANAFDDGDDVKPFEFECEDVDITTMAKIEG